MAETVKRRDEIKWKSSFFLIIKKAMNHLFSLPFFIDILVSAVDK